MKDKPSDKPAGRHDAAAIELAIAAGRVMWAQDHVARLMGMELLEVAPGRARLAMLVRGDMLNGHQTCHGGLIFTLADTAFAYACNSYNHVAVASACQVDFLVPAHAGDRLEADAVERSATGRTGIYDVTIRDGKGTTIALFRGKSHRLPRELIPTAGH